MRDLLYFSEAKMRSLVPQLPARLRKRLGFEAGVSAGLFSIKATLPPDQASSLIGALDQVIEMLAAERFPRWRTDPEIRTGDWIQFTEDFRFGEVSSVLPSATNLDLVFFSATSGPPFLLCGSGVHLLENARFQKMSAYVTGICTLPTYLTTLAWWQRCQTRP